MIQTAIDAKVSFIDSISHELSSKITINVLEIVKTAIADVMERFDICELTAPDERDDMIECYIDAMQVQGRSEKTIERYRYILERLMKYLKIPVRKVTVYHLRKYITYRKSNGIQDSTMEGERQIFSAFFNWLQRESLIEKNPTANLGTVKCAKKEKKTFSDMDMMKLYNGCKTIRDKAIIAFLSSTGCRISEMTGLNRNSIDVNSLECVVRGKGNKERIVYMSQVAGMYIMEYLEQRKDDNIALFAGKQRERLQPNGVRAMLKLLAKEVGVDHVHPHKFRRTLATELSRKGMPLQEVARVLGHDKIDTTMRYVVLNNDDVKASYRKFA